MRVTGAWGTEVHRYNIILGLATISDIRWKTCMGNPSSMNSILQLGHSTTDRPKKSRNNTLHLRFRLNFAHRVSMAVNSHGENFSLVRRVDFEI